MDIEISRTHVSESLKVLYIQKGMYARGVDGRILEDHFMSIEHGLQFCDKILEVSENRYLKLRIQHVVAIVKEKLDLLQNNQGDENLIVKLEHTYSELREQMQNVVFEPGTNNFDELFPKWHYGKTRFKTRYFILQNIDILVTSSCKADQISPMIKELAELRKKVTSLKPLIIYARQCNFFSAEEALTTFLDRATCLIYVSFVGNLNEGMLASLREHLSVLIKETEIKKKSLVLGIIFEDDLEPDRSPSVWQDNIDISLSLLQRQEVYHICTDNESVLKDHIMSLTHVIEFVKWFPRIYNDVNLERRIIQLAASVRQKLEWLTNKQGDENLNMDVNSAYADLREEMKNLIINPEDYIAKKIHSVSEEEFIGKDYLRRNNDFILEKIATLITRNCKAGQLDSLKQELEGIRMMLTFLKPLDLFVDHNFFWFEDRLIVVASLLTIHRKTIFLIYLAYIGKVDIERMILVRETDVCEMYIIILNRDLFGGAYVEESLYLLENVILLLKSNSDSWDDATSKLYEVLIDIHIFLLRLSPKVILRKLHFLHASFEDILSHSIPIICSCYLQHAEVDILYELNCVLEKINHIKSEVQEIKLYSFPRVDDLGFLEFFSDYLEDILKNQEISIKEDLDALHFEVHSLLSLAKLRSREEFNETPWTDIINMSYQAEYIIDLYLASSTTDLGHLSALSKIIGQLQNIRADVHGLSCKSLPVQNVAVTSRSQVLGMTTQTSANHAIVSLPEESIIKGYLLNGENELDCIAIIGMAGVGKTTLASTLYNTPSTADHFDILAWCTVSQSYEIKALLLTILAQVDESDRSELEDEALADHLCKRLRKRRYFIALDDIWDATVWNYLKRYLPDDRNGSRILITTRNRDVADQISCKVNELNGLSDEKSWKLFKKRLIERESLSDDLRKISKGVVELCKGLPLSIVIIAGILSSIERTEKKWNQIAESVSSLVLSDPKGECKAILELSYNHLPNHLQSCFLYLGSFREDEEILVDHLIKLWIGEGFVRETVSENAEEVAEKYMEDLIVKSLVIPVKERSRGGVKTFRLHDLLHDFCLVKAKEKHLFTTLGEGNDYRHLQDPRRLIINKLPSNLIGFSCHSIRSLICNTDFRIGLDMVLLQVLWVNGLMLDDLPSLSSLVHLRYLAFDVGYQGISVVPVSICKLQNLQTLIIKSCEMIEVPDFIWDMVKLRHVDIGMLASFQVDSNRLQNSLSLLENLRSLSYALVSWDDSKWLSKLTRLQKLTCDFVDDDLKLDDTTDDDYVTDDDDVTEEGDVTEEEDVTEDDNIDNYQFRMLSFNSHLTSLIVCNSAGIKQRFIRTCQMPISLQELTLSEFYLKSSDISKIGRTLEHLEVFKIYSCYVTSGYEWCVDDDDFPKLKVLKLTDLKICKWNVSEDSFPSLEQLWVKDCNHLDEIPLDFGSLPKLRLISVIDCARSVDDSAREIERQQHEEQNAEMIVRIHHNK